MKMSRMRMSRCVPVATNTHSQYVIIIASPLQQLLFEPASVLHSLVMLLNILFYIFLSDFFFTQGDIFLSIIYLDLKVDRVPRSSAQFCRN